LIIFARNIRISAGFSKKLVGGSLRVVAGSLRIVCCRDLKDPCKIKQDPCGLLVGILRVSPQEPHTDLQRSLEIFLRFPPEKRTPRTINTVLEEKTLSDTLLDSTWK